MLRNVAPILLIGLRDYGTANWEGGDAECSHIQSENKHGGQRADRNQEGYKKLYQDVCGLCGAVRIDKQIGLEATPAEFVAKMVEVFEEVRRVLKKDGVLFLNLGDSYFGSGKGLNGDGSLGKINSAKQRSNHGSLLSDVGRATACDISGKALVNSQASDCLCRNLCDACRVAYRIGKSHNGYLHAPTQEPLLCETSREHTELPSGHLPTSDSSRPAVHIGDAIPDSLQIQDHEAEQLPASQVSTLGQSSEQFQDDCLPTDMLLVCQLCEKSLKTDAQAFAHRTACNCDTERPLGASNSDRSGIVSSDSAYLYSTTTFLKPKDLIGIPWRVAFALQEAGWWLRQDIIWSKPNPMPESVTDRCTKAHEYIFLLTKSAKYFYDHEAIREPVNGGAHARGPGNKSHRSADEYTNGDEHHRTKSGLVAYAERQRAVGVGPKASPAGSGVKYNESFSASIVDLVDARNKRSVWTVTTQPYSEAHFATFPPKLIEPCILAGSREGDTVLDPFNGAGTTGLVSLRHRRNYIGIELNPEYIKIAEKRLSEVQVKLF